MTKPTNILQNSLNYNAMKKLFTLTFLCFKLAALAQNHAAEQFICHWEPTSHDLSTETTPHSANGYIHTPKGDLHVLVLFISFDDNNDTIFDYESPNNTNALRYWAPNDLPNWAKGNSNALFDKTASTIGQKRNLSNWFNIMSMGNFTVTGEVFPEMVRLPAALRGAYPQAAAQTAAWTYIRNNPAYDGFPWSNFDKRGNKTNWSEDNSNSAPDNKLDYVFIFFRESGVLTGAAGIVGSPVDNGFGVTVNHGAIATSFDLGNPIDKLRGYFLHEFAHQLYQSPHYNGANDVRSDGKYFTPSHGWGFMPNLLPQFETVNAWERWWLGWKDPIVIERDTIITINDFMTSGDAIRIELPGSGEDNLWLEYHGRIYDNSSSSAPHPNDFDRKPFYGTAPEGTQTRAALYGYVTRHGEDQDNPVNLGTDFLSCTNFIKHLHNGGGTDFGHVHDNASNPQEPAQYSYYEIGKNPFSGYTKYQGILKDYDGNGVIQKTFSDGNTNGSSSAANLYKLNSQGNIAMSAFSSSGVTYQGFTKNSNLYLYALKNQNIQDLKGLPVYDRAALLNLTDFIPNSLGLDLNENDELLQFSPFQHNTYLLAYRRRSDGLIIINKLTENFQIAANFNQIEIEAPRIDGVNNKLLIKHKGGDIYIVGAFEKVNGITSTIISKFSSDGSLNSNFEINKSFMSAITQNGSYVFSLGDFLIDDSDKLLLAGTGVRIGSINYGIVRLNQNGTEDITFQKREIPSGMISCISQFSNGTYLIGGSFGTISSSSSHNIEILSYNGAILPSPFGTGLNGSITSIYLDDDDNIYCTGSFTTYNNQTIRPLIKIMPNGSLDVAFLNNTSNIPLQSPKIISLTSNNEIILYSFLPGFGFLESQSIYRERSNINSSIITTYAATGTSTDGFIQGNIIGISGETPVVNLNKYIPKLQKSESLKINGISIDVLSANNGICQLRIKLNDRVITKNLTWSGEISLPDAANGFSPELTLNAGKLLTLDLSRTPNVNLINPNASSFGSEFAFSQATNLKLENGSIFLLENNSQVDVKRLSTLDIGAGSELNLDANALVHVKNKGVFRIGGTLRMASGSKLIIDNDSKLVIEPGATFLLESDDAVVEMRGELHISSGALFQISGVPNGQRGFLKFFQGAIVTAEFGSTIVLGETNNFRKVLELAPNAQIALPATLAQFSINHGEVQMAPGSRLLVHTKAVFMNARFERLGTTGLHQGVLLTGNYPHQIMASRFNHASTGLELNLIGNLHQPQLLSNQFNNNQTGLYVHGGGVLIGSGSFSNNTAWGMRLLAFSAASQVNNVTLNNNFSGIQVASTNSHPINIQGCSIIRNAREVSSIGIEVIQGNVNCRNNTISYHSTGIAALGQGAQLRLACNNISQADEGIAAFNFARLDLSNQARNIISNSVISTIYTDHGLLQLNHGYNDLSNNTNALPIFGIVAPNCYVLTTIYTQTGAEVFYELPAENNKFESGFYYPNAGQASISPFLETNYHVCDAFGGLTLDKSTFYPVYRKANHPNIAFLSCSQANPPWWHDVFNTVSIDGDPSTFVVNSPLYPGVELKQAIRTALNDITIDLEQPQNDSLALARFKQILTATYIDMDDSGRELLATANSAMNFALGNAYALGILPVEYGVNPEPLNDMVYTLLSSLDELIAHSDDENLRIKYALDKVLLYRLAGHYETAIAELQNSLANQHQNFGYWDCILQLEWSYFQGHIGADQFAQEAQQCMSMYQARRRRRQPPSMPNYHSTVSNALAVSPNPSNSSSTVSFTRTESPAWLQLTDAQGKLVYRLPIEVGNTQVNLNAQQLPMGVYLIELHEPAKTVLRAKWVVSK